MGKNSNARGKNYHFFTETINVQRLRGAHFGANCHTEQVLLFGTSQCGDRCPDENASIVNHIRLDKHGTVDAIINSHVTRGGTRCELLQRFGEKLWIDLDSLLYLREQPATML